MPETKYRYPLIEGRIALAENRIEDALRCLDNADSQYAETPNPCHRPPIFWKAIALLNKGNCELLMKHLPFENSITIDPFSYLAFVITDPSKLNRVKAVTDKLDYSKASPSLQFALKVVSAIEAESNGDIKSAEEILKQAVLLVAENSSAMWLTEIKAVHHLFEKHNVLHQELLSKESEVFLVEPLSSKETQVLRWLDTELNGPQIASKLFVSLNTLRTHTKNIYSKLGVNSRRAAVKKARAYKLLY